MLSLACGAGVNLVAEMFPKARIIPATNSTFCGSSVGQGKFVEHCGGCGDCVLDRTAGVCPIVRCAKSLLNGPCGGCQEGKCEINPETDCAWYIICERLQLQGRPHLLDEIQQPKDWRPAGHGGPRTLTRDELVASQ